MKNALSVLIAFLLISSGSLMAQRGQHRNQNYKETCDFIKTDVFPIVQKERSSFEQKLNTAEKKTIAAVRIELASNNAKLIELRKAIRAERKRPAAGEQAEMKQLREAKKVAFERLRPIVEAHSEDFKALRISLEDQKTAWAEKVSVDYPNACLREKRGRRNGIGQEMIRPIRFLILDPAKTFNENEKMFRLKPARYKKGRHAECGRRHGM